MPGGTGSAGFRPRGAGRHLRDDLHAPALGCWHMIVAAPMVPTKRMAETVQDMTAHSKSKPAGASPAGDVKVEEAAEYLYAHGIPAHAYSTELPVLVLGGKYKWARGAGLIK